MKSYHKFQILNDNQISKIKETAFNILEKTGIQVLHQEARNMLEKQGANVEVDRVKIPKNMVLDCVEKAPTKFTIFDRLGEPRLHINGEKNSNFYYGTSTASPQTRDPITKKVRETTVEDIEFGAELADCLENIDFVMPMGSAQNVGPKVADVYEFEGTLLNTIKPIVFIALTPEGLKTIYKMAAEVRGGMEKLREKPFVVSYPEPISPLVYPAEVVEKILISAELGMPQIPGPTVQPGTTGPVTIAGSLAQLVAEGLMSVVLIQTKNPGSPCFLAGNFNIFDMDTTLMSVSAPEMSLGTGAHAEIARTFGLPSWGLAGATDSKGIDAQAGVESAFSILGQGLAGVDLIHDVGYLDMAMVCSPEMLMLGDEVAGMAKRFFESFTVTDETLAEEVVYNAGPGGNFLKERHTFENYRKSLWMPSLFNRQRRKRWKNAGEKPVDEVIRDKIKNIMETNKQILIPEQIRVNIAKIRDEGVEKILQ